MKWRHTATIAMSIVLVGSIAYAIAPIGATSIKWTTSAATPCAPGTSCMWVKTSDGLPYWHKTDNTNTSMVGGGSGGTFATTYSSTAADNRVTVTSTGGPLLLKPGSAGQGAVLQAQTSAGVELVSIYDNAGSTVRAVAGQPLVLSGANDTGGYLSLESADFYAVTPVRFSFNSLDSDGASASAFRIHTNNTWSNASAKLLSLVNNATEKMNVSAAGHVTAHHYNSTQASAPTISCGVGAGTSPTCNNPTGTDVAMTITITTGSSPSGANADVATITFNESWGSAPTCLLNESNAVTAALYSAGGNIVRIYPANTTTSVFKLTSGGTALAGATTYQWTVHCLQ